MQIDVVLLTKKGRKALCEQIEHQLLCKAIEKEIIQHWDNPKGLGDIADSEVFVSLPTPRKHAALAKHVGQKCLV